MTALAYGLVFLGGGLGSVCRYGIAHWLRRYEFVFPLATLCANLLSCILLGALVGLSLRQAASHPHRYLWMVGFCGGFSTFSTFTHETYALLQNGQTTYAILNVAVSLLICLLGIWLGLMLVPNR